MRRLLCGAGDRRTVCFDAHHCLLHLLPRFAAGGILSAVVRDRPNLAVGIAAHRRILHKRRRHRSSRLARPAAALPAAARGDRGRPPQSAPTSGNPLTAATAPSRPDLQQLLPRPAVGVEAHGPR